MKRLETIIIALTLATAACGAVEDGGADGTQTSGGKDDSFTASSNELRLSGDRDQSISLDDANQCEAQQFNFIGGWRNADDRNFDMPLFRVMLSFAGGRVPIAGAVLDVAGSSRVSFDGIGYSTEGGAGCQVEVSDLVNGGQGKRFGIALEFRECELVAGDRKINLEGTVSCTGAGFDLLFDPEPEPEDPTPVDPGTDPDTPAPVQTCSDDEYRAWSENVLSTIDGTGSSLDPNDIVDIDASLTGKPCEAVNDVLYLEWLEEFEARVNAAGSVIDDADVTILDAVLALRPSAQSEAAHLAWFDVYTRFLRKVAPQSGSSIDAADELRLSFAHRARVAADGEDAYAAWFELTASYFRGMAPSGAGQFDADETEIYEELMAQKSVAGGGANFASFRTLFDSYVNDIIRSGNSTIDANEALLLERALALRPGSGSDEAYVNWAAGFGSLLNRVGSRAGEGAQGGLQSYLDAKPCVATPTSDAVNAANASLPAASSDTDPRASFITAAAPTACQ